MKYIDMFLSIKMCVIYLQLVEYMFLVHLSEGVSALPDSIDVAINLDQSSDQSSSDQAWFTVQGNTINLLDIKIA